MKPRNLWIDAGLGAATLLLWSLLIPLFDARHGPSSRMVLVILTLISTAICWLLREKRHAVLLSTTLAAVIVFLAIFGAILYSSEP